VTFHSDGDLNLYPKQRGLLNTLILIPMNLHVFGRRRDARVKYPFCMMLQQHKECRLGMYIMSQSGLTSLEVELSFSEVQ